MPGNTDTVIGGKHNGTWVKPLADAIRNTSQHAESRMRTVISCDIRSGKPALFLPPDMAELQPQSLRYLHAFAKTNDLSLIEDRRRIEIQPMVEQRNRKPPMIAKGLSMLLKQTGLPGSSRPLSEPHRLNADSPHIGIARLVEMAAFAEPRSKRVVILPNRMMVNVLNNDTQPISGYACKMNSAHCTSILSHFDSTNFRAVGYSAGRQYIMHVCLAGGPLMNSSLWTQVQTLTRTDFRFQLFPGRQTREDFGLFYATFYLNLSETPTPWWLQNQSADGLEVIPEEVPDTLKPFQAEFHVQPQHKTG
jgi:hypothetical protein